MVRLGGSVGYLAAVVTMFVVCATAHPPRLHGLEKSKTKTGGSVSGIPDQGEQDDGVGVGVGVGGQVSKYFKESPDSAHMDARFADPDVLSSISGGGSSNSNSNTSTDPASHAVLTDLFRSYTLAMRDLGVDTWLAHGSLLGWFWGRKFLPWDPDIDVHVYWADFAFLARYHNMSVFPFGPRRYLLDINPVALAKLEQILPGRPGPVELDPDEYRARSRTRVPGSDDVDGRWIDMATGLFIDITALAYTSTTDGLRVVRAHDGHAYRLEDVYPLQPSRLEAIDIAVPYSPENLLAQEYGRQALLTDSFGG